MLKNFELFFHPFYGRLDGMLCLASDEQQRGQHKEKRKAKWTTKLVMNLNLKSVNCAKAVLYGMEVRKIRT